ncbi:MAG TPA: YceI family protein [Gemmatimonadales bacterium]|nr:YceI family protein [Gemmatimonadales bacterium]
MIRWFRAAAVTLVLALRVAPAGAQAPTPIPAGTVQEGVLSFDGKATAGDFSGTTGTVNGELAGGATLDLVTGFVEAPVKTLVTGNGRRDRDLNKSMESDTYPTIRFELAGVDSIRVEGDSTRASLRGTMKIHGVDREVALPSVLHFTAGGVRVRSTFPLNLKDYRIGGLSKMLGMLKMHPDIVVHVDVLFDYHRH